MKNIITRKKYPDYIKKFITKQVEERGGEISSVANEFGIPKGTIHGWVKQKSELSSTECERENTEALRAQVMKIVEELSKLDGML